jgi:hypothetical protein
MDSASDNINAIIIYGGMHTSIYPYKNYYDSSYAERFEWIPLGYHLKKHYGTGFSSYEFVTDHDKDFVISPKHLLDETKLVLLRNIPLVKIPVLNNVITYFSSQTSYTGRNDGYIVEPETIQGTFYQYNPTNLNLSFLFKSVEDYALSYSPDINYVPFETDNEIIRGINFLKSSLAENFDYAFPSTSYNVYDPHGQFMLGLYYLKMYFGDKFDYSFWKTESTKSLLSALEELKEYAFMNNEPAEYIRINYSRDTLGLYHKYMNLSDVEYFNIQAISAKYIQDEYLLRAGVMFPEDLWSLYWLGFTAAEKEKWEKSLEYFEMLFAHALSFSMESLPLAYQKAALCAGKLGNSLLAEEYHRIARALFNEYNITVDQNSSSFVGY